MSDVVSYQATPEMLAELEQRAARKYGGPEVKRWERTMTREQYLAARLAGTSLEDIMLSYFNNESKELRKQLREWELDQNTEQKELEAMASKPVELTITKEEYLQRRLNGEKRSHIMSSLGVANPRFYALLDKWGIREMDAEGRALELMAPTAPAPEAQETAKEVSEIDKRVAEQLEQRAEARGLLALNAQNGAAPDAGAEILQRMEERAAAQAEEIAELRADRNNWESEYSTLETVYIELQADRDAWRGRADELKQSLADLTAERDILLQTIEQAAAHDTSMIVFRVPIQAAAVANAERSRIYDAIEAIGTGMEAADIDRGRVMRELFDLLQRVVNFVTADLVELHPGQSVERYIHQFFAYHNERHLESLVELKQQEAG
ncbi:hypothetical protein [Paenibacillus sp. SYP-B4298]|uniref:hypothetical protein n=1 Tax=Paenibacillus sp. SYP-B4298 TaxID=2996034 RepID=UPI0022DE4FA8|nr:hypothetical protein [Paenibacillus sp. SYP-B4298]